MSRLAARILVPSVILLLGALVAVNAYRAWTQSITYDEAYTYVFYVSGPVGGILANASANNHVLFSLLAKTTTVAFGPSELSLRLPSVAAGALYLAAVFLLSRLIFGYGLTFVAAVAALAMNPFVLDFLSAARGYGLALALFIVAFYQLAMILARKERVVKVRDTFRWVAASLALASSVLANFAFAFPCAGLALSALTLGVLDEMGTRREGLSRFTRRILLSFCLPGSVVVWAVLAVWLRRAKLASFYYGAQGLDETVRSLVDMSLRHHPSTWPLNTTGTAAAILVTVATVVLVPLTITAVAAAATIVAMRGVHARSMESLTTLDRVLVLLTGAGALTLVLLIAAHWFWKVAYPLDRTGLYFIPMFILGLALLAQWTNLQARWTQGVRRSAFAVLGGLVLQSTVQFNVTQYGMWHFDSGTRTLYRIIASWPHLPDEKPFQVATSSDYFAPSLTYYQLLDTVPRVALVSDGWIPMQAGNFDFFVVEPDDAEPLRQIATLVCVHSVSNAMLFVNQARPTARGLDRARVNTDPSADCQSVLRSLQSHS